MSHDAATSMRGDKPGLFATLDVAIAQSGVTGITSDELYAMSSWSIRQGRRLPWYYKNENNILATEGGRDSVIITLAGAALALLRDGKLEDPSNPVANACYLAGIAWRNDLRRQWGDVNKDRTLWQNPVLFTDLGEGGTTNENGEHEPVEDWITEHAVELAGPTSPEFDPENITDPRLAALWGNLTDKQRTLLGHVANGVNVTQSAELMDMDPVHAHYLIRKTRTLAKGAAF